MNTFFKRRFSNPLFILALIIHSLLQSSQIIDSLTTVDLEILPRTDRPNLLDTVDNTSTLAGRKQLRSLLSQPTADTQVLTQRQQSVAFFMAKNDLATQLHTHLRLLATHEKSLATSQALAKNPLITKALQEIYFSAEKFKKYNTSPSALNAGYILHIASLCLPLAEYLIMHTSINALVGIFAHTDCNHSSNPNAGKLEYYGTQGLLLCFHVPALRTMVNDIKHRAQITKQLQQEMIDVREYLTQARAIYCLLQKESLEPEVFPALQVLDSFFSATPTASFKCLQLMKFLESFTFSGTASTVNHVGKVLATYTLYKEVEEELAQLFEAVGTIDVSISTAKTLTNQTKTTPWCFAEYRDASTPHIFAQNLRHLFLQKTLVKPWSIITAENNHILLTGDNGSGKSTYINGLGQALVLAQSLGIAPAEKFEVTPFDTISTYRFIEDNIFEGTSRFYAECARIEDILTAVETSTGFCCVLLDEPFTSTHALKGSQYLHDALSRLFKTRHITSFTATHYHTLNDLLDAHKKSQHIHLI